MTEEDLEEVTELSGVLDAPVDYISSSLRKELHDFNRRIISLEQSSRP